MQDRRYRAGIAAFLLTACLAAGADGALAQQQWLNSPLAATGNPVIPFFEGWYDNGDGTLTLSFGYLNRNPRDVVEIPLGARNRIEPAEFDGRQPSHFLPTRNRGMFAVTIPASRRDLDVWWYLTDDRGNEYKVPGRARSSGYQLDWNPRPHGSLPPWMWFTSERDARRGPEGIYAPETLTTRVGQPLTLTVETQDPSVRDATDPRFRNGIPVNVSWSKYQGPPGAVTFERHPSHPDSQRPTARGRGAPPLGRDAVALSQGGGTARVIATFEAPGDYILRAEANNWNAPDSQSIDQCCWTNAYVRVRVSP
ncbi:MAG: hypothetical protein FJ207_11565 [Gemmatimonadetes bacterium]|nr:hypothetical protein [Gemmatimonadota bacterium]